MFRQGAGFATVCRGHSAERTMPPWVGLRYTGRGWGDSALLQLSSPRVESLLIPAPFLRRSRCEPPGEPRDPVTFRGPALGGLVAQAAPSRLDLRACVQRSTPLPRWSSRCERASTVSRPREGSADRCRRSRGSGCAFAPRPPGMERRPSPFLAGRVGASVRAPCRDPVRVPRTGAGGLVAPPSRLDLRACVLRSTPLPRWSSRCELASTVSRPREGPADRCRDPLDTAGGLESPPTSALPGTRTPTSRLPVDVHAARRSDSSAVTTLASETLSATVPVVSWLRLRLRASSSGVGTEVEVRADRRATRPRDCPGVSTRALVPRALLDQRR